MKKKVYGHVAVIGIDGMGAFCDNAPTPNFDRIFKNGCRTSSALSMAPTISAQNWGAMLLGAKPSVHGITNENISLKRYSNEALPSVFARIRQSFPDAKLYSFSNWSPINFGLIEDGIGVKTDTDKSDEALCERITECIKETPDFLFVQFDEVDGAGHKYTYGSPEHLAAISREDSYVGRIYDEYCLQGIIDDTLFIVITDHGGNMNGHGGFTDSEKYIFFGAAGKTVKKSSKPTFMQTRDISAIVLYAFGIDIPEYDKNGYSSQVPQGVFIDFDKPYYKVNPTHSDPVTKETPKLDSENGLYGFFDRNDVELAVDFDNSTEDKTGKHTVNEYGTVKYYSGGVRGSFAELGKTGFSKVSDLSFKNKNFSVSFWVKMNPDMGMDNPPVFSNKSWDFRDRNKPGFCIFLCRDSIRIHFGYDSGNTEQTAVFPEDVSGGWVHTVVIFDKENGMIRFFFNFEPAGEFELSDVFFENIDSFDPVIGNDALGTYSNKTHKMAVLLDDLILFSNALDEDDIKKLGKYYE